MKKLGVKSRVFLSFTIFIILIINIFSYFLLSFVIKTIENDTKKSMLNEFETIKTLIDLQEETSLFILPKIEIEKINNLGFYFYIGNNDKNLQKKYKLGFEQTEDAIIYRGDYNSYNIILGKTTRDLKNLEKKFYEILIFFNIFLIIISFFISYLITNFSLKPLFNLSKFLDNYDFSKKNNLIKNNYANSEIGILTDSINNFIKQNNNILEQQKNFIQDVSHELKTPLMQIDSNIELIEEKISDEKIRKKLEEIKNSTKNLGEIISNLSFILRGEEVIKNKEKKYICDYLKNFVKKYENLANKKNIEIKINCIKNFFIENNDYYLDRFFGNILSNAIFYNKGNNTIEITIKNNFVSIKDEGIGIEKNDLDKIFSRFYRNKNSNIFYQNGNGLGLAIVKKISLMFGWKIKIKSEVGKGTIFEIFF